MLNAAVAIDGFPLLLLLIGVRIAVCPFLLLLWPQLRVCHAHFIASLSAQAALAAVLFILAVFFPLRAVPAISREAGASVCIPEKRLCISS